MQYNYNCNTIQLQYKEMLLRKFRYKKAIWKKRVQRKSGNLWTISKKGYQEKNDLASLRISFDK